MAIAMGPLRVIWSHARGAWRLSKSEGDREGQFHSQVFERYRSSEPEVAQALTQMDVARSEHAKGGRGGSNAHGSRTQCQRRTLTEQYEAWRERQLLPHYRILYAGR